MRWRRARPRIFTEIEEQPEILQRLPGHNREALATARALLQSQVNANRQVLLMGMGSGHHLAQYGARVIEEHLEADTKVLDVPGKGSFQPRWREGELVVVLSQSGRTSALVQCCRDACAAGATVISITNEPESTLAHLAKVNIACNAGEETVVAATKSVTAQAVALRAMAAELNPHAVDELVAAARAALAVDVSRLRRRRIAAVVGAGAYGKAIAEEVALKYIETSGDAPIAESTADFLHGPMALRGRVLLFNAAGDDNAARIAANPGAITIGVAGDGADIVIPRLADPALDAIVKLVVGQRAAATRGLRLFGNPDSPRGLSKVTDSA